MSIGACRKKGVNVTEEWNARTLVCVVIVFFFNDTATTEIYTLSLHDALPISFTG